MKTALIIEKLSSHSILKKGFKKLTKEEVATLTKVLEESSTKEEGAIRARNLIIDGRASKNWKELDEMISCGLTLKFGV